jgi:hypothetical protein
LARSLLKCRSAIAKTHRPKPRAFRLQAKLVQTHRHSNSPGNFCERHKERFDETYKRQHQPARVLRLRDA